MNTNINLLLPLTLYLSKSKDLTRSGAEVDTSAISNAEKSLFERQRAINSGHWREFLKFVVENLRDRQDKGLSAHSAIKHAHVPIKASGTVKSITHKDKADIQTAPIPSTLKLNPAEMEDRPRDMQHFAFSAMSKSIMEDRLMSSSSFAQALLEQADEHGEALLKVHTYLRVYTHIHIHRSSNCWLRILTCGGFVCSAWPPRSTTRKCVVPQTPRALRKQRFPPKWAACFPAVSSVPLPYV
jgi:hypothetical protein